MFVILQFILICTKYLQRKYKNCVKSNLSSEMLTTLKSTIICSESTIRA